ncbi:hypothetical protein [Terrimonas alba]|uniref:hypothetical protein n=1 Tax=Terrimonas alba TaxID=3349636 RepID=UPI0035F46DA5
MTDLKYKYEVAFSFLQRDEQIAYQINDLIQDRIEAFIYSKKQEELGGTDGEKKFNEVFYKECRIVVLLYRNGWGATPWTRIEETAIRNRAFELGWDFLLLVNLDKTSTLPAWIPKTYIWFDFERWKSEGLAPVIEQKVKETGGNVRPESIEDKANRFKRLKNAVREREKFFYNGNAIAESDNEVKKIIALMKEAKSTLEDPETYFTLNFSERREEMYEFGHDSHYLCFNWHRGFYELKDRKLVVTIYEKLGHYGINEGEKRFKQVEYKFDRDLNENNIWTSNKKNYSSEDLVKEWIGSYLEVLSQREKNRR